VRRRAGRWTTAATLVTAVPAGASTRTVRRPLAAGRYRVSVTVTAAGTPGTPLVRGLRVGA